MSVTHLHATSGNEDSIDTCAELISALINEGSYLPAQHGLHPADVWAHRKVHEFCIEHQEVTGSAPSADQVQRRFADFPYNPDAQTRWAVHEFARENYSRKMRALFFEAQRALLNDDPQLAYQIVREQIDSFTFEPSRPVNATETAFYLDAPATCPVASEPLMRITGGIKPGHLWIVGAVTGTGKTYDLIQHAVVAAAHGWNVEFFSLEMDPSEVLRRMHLIMVGPGHAPEMIPDLVDQWFDTPGRGYIQLHDKATIDDIRRVAKPETLILIDYISLIQHSSKVADRYQRIADAADQLRQVTKVSPIIAAAQLNREAAGRRKSEPTMGDFADSMNIVRGADLVVAMTGESGSRVRKYYVLKNRHGAGGQRWFVDFQPRKGTFTEISEDTAERYLALELTSPHVL